MPDDDQPVLVADPRTPQERIREVLAAIETREPTLADFGAVVREMRKVCDLYLGELADMLGVTAAKVSDVELGKAARPIRAGAAPPPPRRAYYFGCWNQPGHYLFYPGGRSVRHEERTAIKYGDGVHLDGSYAPRLMGPNYGFAAQGKTREARQRIAYDAIEAPQGQFLRHERGGFTLIQWWDRSQGDTRGACNSTFLLEGSRTTVEMLAALAALFPTVPANLKRAGVELVEVFCGP